MEGGLNVTGVPSTKYHLTDLVSGVDKPELLFQQLIVFENGSFNGVGTAGYVDYMPDWLWNGERKKTGSTWILDSEIARISGRMDDCGLFLEIVSKTDGYSSDLIAGAAIYSLSLLAGRRVQWLCLTSVSNTEARSFFFSDSSAPGEFYSLFDFPSSNNSELVFSKAMKHFCENPTSDMPRLMGILWDFSQGDFDVQALLLGVAIEGIAKEINGKRFTVDQSTEEFKERALLAIQNLDSDLLGLKEGDRQRMLGIIRGSNTSSTRHVIEMALKSIGCDSERFDLSCWSRVRNRRSHGRLAWEFPSREELADFLTCVDLANTLCLGMLGVDDADVSSTHSAAIIWELEQTRFEEKKD